MLILVVPEAYLLLIRYTSLNFLNCFHLKYLLRIVYLYYNHLIHVRFQYTKYFWLTFILKNAIVTVQKF